MPTSKKINLVPADLRVSPKTLKYASFLYKISTVLAIFLIMAAIGLAGAFLYFSSRVKTITQEVDNLKQEVVSLEGSEQKLILTKDRLARINEIKALSSAEEGLTKFQEIKNYIASSDEARIADVSINKDKVEGSVFSKSSSTLGSFLASVANSNIFKSVVLSSLGYNKVSGYAVGLLFSSVSDIKK